MRPEGTEVREDDIKVRTEDWHVLDHHREYWLHVVYVLRRGTRKGVVFAMVMGGRFLERYPPTYLNHCKDMRKYLGDVR